MANKIGTIGQYKGPFSSSENIATKIGIGAAVKFGVTIGEKDYMKIKNFKMKINGATLTDPLFHIGKTFIYEIDDKFVLSELSFPEGAPASTIIDYVIL